MSAALHLAGPGDVARLEPMVAAYHALKGIETTQDMRLAALEQICAGIPHGACWLIGPRSAPVGYIAISFGFSVELGGIDAILDEFFIRENVRGRGMGGEVLARLLPELAEQGLRALTLEVSPANARAQRLYARAGFRLRDGYGLMTRTF